ncbi:MAG TPA: purine-nucleoside phosphorylase [Treponemataceae bacterium]|nr:purine-nucleoside phosphorylase [Treponemataceae bacterium]HQL04275.1 purine-nucleoside phosphorylase [Treponemataceae bacterium]
MSIHIEAKAGDIADTVLLPGDPLRAKFIAENFLENAFCYTKVRNMFGFTGTYKGKKISVQGTGMGQPSISIYANELFSSYGVQTAVRIGTCGAVHTSTKVRDVILALSACTDSANLVQRFGRLHYAPSADFSLLNKAYETSKSLSIPVLCGPVASTDLFYDENDTWKLWAQYGVLAMEMETAELYTLAAKYGRKALSILTVSDHIASGESTSAEERQNTFSQMMKLALETLL